MIENEAKIQKLKQIVQARGSTEHEEATAKKILEKLYSIEINSSKNIEKPTAITATGPRIIAVINRSGGAVYGYRLFYESYIRFNIEGVKVINSDKYFTIRELEASGCVNATWSKATGLIGTECDIDRLPVLYHYSRRLDNDGVIILAKLIRGQDVQYKVTDYSGIVMILSKRELLDYADTTGLCNAKVVTKGGKRYVDPLKGEFKTIILDG